MLFYNTDTVSLEQIIKNANFIYRTRANDQKW